MGFCRYKYFLAPNGRRRRRRRIVVRGRVRSGEGGGRRGEEREERRPSLKILDLPPGQLNFIQEGQVRGSPGPLGQGHESSY